MLARVLSRTVQTIAITALTTKASTKKIYNFDLFRKLALATAVSLCILKLSPKANTI